MKKTMVGPILLVMVPLLGILSGCAAPGGPPASPSGSAPPGTSTPTTAPAPEILPAPIDQVRVDFLQTQPAQVSVYIKVGLPDTCTRFHDIATHESGNAITINVRNEKQTGQVCGNIYSFIEKNVNLGSNFAPGQTYTVVVNDQTTNFTMPVLRGPGR